MDPCCPVCELFRSSFGIESIAPQIPESCGGPIHATREAGERPLSQVDLGEDELMVSEDRAQAREGSEEAFGSHADVAPRRRKILRDNPAPFYGVKRKAKAA